MHGIKRTMFTKINSKQLKNLKEIVLNWWGKNILKILDSSIDR